MTAPNDRMSKLIERAGQAIGRVSSLLEQAGVKAGVGVDEARAKADRMRVSPLADWAQPFAAASAMPANFSIREVPFVTQIIVRGNAGDAAFAAGLRSALGRDLLPGANTWTGTPETSVIWLGPDELMVTAPAGRNDTMTALLRNSLRSLHFSVSDLSANRTVIEIAGKHARAVLAKGCPLDLNAAAFPPPHCAQTLLAKSQILLQCLDARPLLRLFVRLSFAPYVAEWLMDAAAETGASHALDTDRIATRLNRNQ